MQAGAMVGATILGGWIGYAVGKAWTGSELYGPPYGFAGSVAGATAAHFLLT